MNIEINSGVILGGLLIFFLRTFDMSVDTLRVLFVVRGKKLIVWCLGVIQSVVYILAISKVLSGPINPVTVLFYAAGFATGNVLGMKIEEWIGIGFKQLSIISREHSDEIAATLREAGYGVTQLGGVGKEGDVCICQTSIKRKQTADVKSIINQIDSNAFVTEDDFRPLSGGGVWRK